MAIFLNISTYVVDLPAAESVYINVDRLVVAQTGTFTNNFTELAVDTLVLQIRLQNDESYFLHPIAGALTAIGNSIP